ncbi:hypothetical protein Pelo_1750 [Pelomyxa schiedti]|nr:hypothetical protein Pelo_1750 [Pelomyxa schiedti]
MAGVSVDPAIDVGQVEGGIMQGIGLYTLEDDTPTYISSPPRSVLGRSWTEKPSDFLKHKQSLKDAIYSACHDNTTHLSSIRARSASPLRFPAPLPRSASPLRFPAPLPRSASPLRFPAPLPRSASPTVP